MTLIRLAFTTILRSWRASLLFILTITVLLVAGTALLNSVNLIQVQVEENLEKHGRGTYDILVRPAGQVNQVEKTFGLVEDNYLSSGDGGISIAEWQEMKSLPLVDIAAPVAAVGYFTGISSSVTLELPALENGGVDIRFKTSDGLQDYIIGTPTTSFIIENRSDFGDFEIIGNHAPYAEVTLDLNDPSPKPITLIPQTYHNVVAIDVNEEEALTGLSFEGLNRPLSGMEEMQLEFAGDAPIIPVLTLQDPRVPLAVEWSFIAQNISDERIEAWRQRLGIQRGQAFFERDHYEGILEIENELRSEHEVTTVYQYAADLSDRVYPFMAKPSVIAVDGSIEDANFHTNSQANTTAYYAVGPLTYRVDGDEVSIVKKSADVNGMPLFREVEKKGGAFYELEKLPFIMHPIGQFSTIDYSEQLAASPLGFYSQLPVLSKDGVELHETINPGGFIQPPAHGLVRISDIERLKESEEPIDAIRLRVTGEGGYTESLVQRVEETAVAISKIGDFQIDIVAGASPQVIPVHVEGIGSITQPWTTLGATVVIAGGWNLIQLMISTLFMIVGFVFLRSRIAFWQLENAAREALLIDIGWQKRDVKRYAAAERNILIGLSIVLGTITLLVFLSFGWLTSGVWKLFFLIAILLYLLSSLFAWLKRKFNKKVKVIQTTSISIKNIGYYRHYIFYSALQLLLVNVLVVFIVGSMFANRAQTSVTLLGEFIDSALGPLLLVTLVAAIGFTVMTTIDGQEAMRRIRLKDISTLRSIGWRSSSIWALWLKETLIWTVPTLVIGSGIGCFIVTLAFQWSTILAIQTVSVSILLLIVILVTVYLGFRRVVR